MNAFAAHHPVTIAHRAGNHRASLQAAQQAGVDFIEADVWPAGERVIARHEKALWRLPLLYDKWSLRFPDPSPLYLADLCAASATGPRLLLDFKGSDPRLTASVVAQLRETRAERRAALCGQNWELLDDARAMEPGLDVFYSLETAAQVEALRARPPAALPIAAASVWQGLLSDAFIRELKERGITVFAWTVNRLERAQQLIASGVAGMISDRLDLLASLSPGRDEAAGLTGAGIQT